MHEVWYNPDARAALGAEPAPPAPTPAPTTDEVANQVISQLPTFPTTDLVIKAAIVVSIIIGLYSIYDHRKLRR